MEGDSSQVKNFFSSLSRVQIAALALGAIGLIAFVVGLIQSNTSKNDITFEKGSQEKGQVEASSTQKEFIMIDVSGAVEKPGVYKLEKDSRVQDALVMAGGLSVKADKDYIEKKINLAQKLGDGMKVYIPEVGEVVSSKGDDASFFTSGSVEGKVNINSATPSELDSLPGVGAVTAEKIINGRPYTAIDELVSKKIVSKSVFEKIKEKISL